MTDTLLSTLQEDIAERCRADEILGAFRVITERRADIASEVQTALGLVESSAGGQGLAIVVLQLVGDSEAGDLPHPFLRLEPAIRILEHPVLNQGALKCIDVARRVARVFWHYQPMTLASAFVPGSPFIRPVADPLAPVAYEVVFECYESEISGSTKVVAPTIEGSSATVPTTVTLTTSTAGAQIYYTLDGSHPHPGEASSIPYTGAFSLTYAARVRAAAYLSGSIASDVTAHHFDAP